MSDMREALVKAGLISKADAKRVEKAIERKHAGEVDSHADQPEKSDPMGIVSPDMPVVWGTTVEPSTRRVRSSNPPANSVRSKDA